MSCSALAIWSPLGASNEQPRPLGYLTPTERAEVADTQPTSASTPVPASRTCPKRSVAKVLNNASPNVRFFMNANKNVVDDLEAGGGRYRPFQERITPASTRTLRLCSTGCARKRSPTGLNERMGTAPVEQPTTLRDIVSASMEHHEEHK